MPTQTTRTEPARHIRGLLASLAGSIIVFNEGWGETLPDWLKHQVKIERLRQSLTHEEEKATHAEATAYLYTASLTRSLNEDWTDIYCYLSKEYASRRGSLFPGGIAPDALTTEQQRLLDRLLRWLRRQTTRISRPRAHTSRQIVQACHEQLHLF